MRLLHAFVLFSFILAMGFVDQIPKSILIKGGTVIDGSGNPGKVVDVRIEGDTIKAVGKLQPIDGEKILDATNLVVAPGFIDAHSHTDGPMEKEPMLESQVRQG